MLIDVHAHYSPARYTAAMQRLTGMSRVANWATLPHTDSQDDIKRRLELMDDAGVRVQVLSHGIMGPYVQDKAGALEAARACNDGYAELVQGYPERFAALVSLPLPHVDAALGELSRGMDELGMIGVAMNCSVFERSTAEAEFEPLYEEMNRRGAVLFFHPCASGICSPMITQYGLTLAAGTSMEDATLTLHLIVKQIPLRYPNIRIIIAHMGGVMPMLLQRLDHQLVQPGLAEPPSVTARRLYYDTVGHGSVAALNCAYRAFGADHLVTGSDWPVLLEHEQYSRTFAWIREAGLPEPDAEQIIERSAATLLRMDQ